MNFISKSSIILCALSLFFTFNPISTAEMNLTALKTDVDMSTAPRAPLTLTLQQLIHRFYQVEIERSRSVLANNIPGPLFLKSFIINDPEYVALIENFEEDPQSFYENSKLLRLVTFDAIRDFYTKDAARQIINFCIFIAPHEIFIMELFKNALIKGVDEIVNFIVKFDFLCAMLKELLCYSADFSLINELANRKSYDLATKMVRKGVFAGYESMLLATFISKAEIASDFVKAQEFMSFLIEEMQINEVSESNYAFESNIIARRAQIEADKELQDHMVDEESQLEKILVH